VQYNLQRTNASYILGQPEQQIEAIKYERQYMSKDKGRKEVKKPKKEKK
jgi:hypothetical protein